MQPQTKEKSYALWPKPFPNMFSLIISLVSIKTLNQLISTLHSNPTILNSTLVHNILLLDIIWQHHHSQKIQHITQKKSICSTPLPSAYIIRKKINYLIYDTLQNLFINHINQNLVLQPNNPSKNKLYSYLPMPISHSELFHFKPLQFHATLSYSHLF